MNKTIQKQQNNKSKKLWQTESALHPLVEKFTIGTDYILDQQLLKYDINGSLAHAKMLAKKGVLTKSEYKKAKQGFAEIISLLESGNFTIAQSQEDGHTAIEQYLTEHYGEVGKKIHTGRSRNDQALVMMRLYMKDLLPSMVNKVKELESVLKMLAKKNKMPMPGYTHAQKAMPTTASTWLTSFADALADQQIFFKSLARLLDQSPLGSASGFGIKNFNTLQSMTAKELGFKKTQKNPMYCGLSRGHFENQFLQTFSSSMLIISRLINDVLLFTMSEYNFMSLPETLTTGSSIMPQKRNYDVLEIARGRVHTFFNAQRELQDICQHLMSGYNRDVQLTKKIFIEQAENLSEILEVMILVIQNLSFNKNALQKAMSDDLFVTEDVYDLVNNGKSFRDAYHEVKKRINSM